MATQESTELAQLLYVAYYGRPADPGGLAFWSERFDSTESGAFAQAINDFGNSDEFASRFGALSNEALVNNLFQQLFGRAPDSEGLAFFYWAIGKWCHYSGSDCFGHCQWRT